MTKYEANLKNMKGLLAMMRGKLEHAFNEQDKGNDKPFEELYKNSFELSFMGKRCEIYFGASEFQAIESLLEEIIKEY